MDEGYTVEGVRPNRLKTVQHFTEGSLLLSFFCATIFFIFYYTFNIKHNLDWSMSENRACLTSYTNFTIRLVTLSEYFNPFMPFLNS